MSLLIQSLANVVSSCGHGACGCVSLPTSQTGRADELFTPTQSATASKVG
jgi:hypothetical protein